MNHRPRDGATLILLGLAVMTGCAGALDEDVAWSTKQQSVLGRGEPGPVAVEPTPAVPDAAPVRVAPAPPPVDPAPVIIGTGREADLVVASVSVLRQALDAPDPLMRANAIEALKHAPEYLDDAVQRGLADENRGVRFVAAMTVGQQGLEHLAHLLQPMLGDPSGSVRAAAIFGLRRNGHPVDLNPLAAMLAGDDPEVKANAALVLGELGDPSAIPLLRASMGRGMARVGQARVRLVDMQIAEALVKLGAEREIEGLRAALFAPPEQGEITAIACQMCGRLRDGRVVSNLLDLATRTGTRQPSPEVRLAAAMAVAEIDPLRAPREVPREYLTSRRPELRAQAALTLGVMNDRSALGPMATLLGDSDGVVRVAAAAGILQITRG